MQAARFCVCWPVMEEILGQIKIGTCAWSYDDWRGVFYPENLPVAKRLPFYASTFSAVEVDATFYAAPTRHATEHWCEVTPRDFCFSCKLPRAITHEKRFRDVAPELREFLENLEPLREKLGCIIVQLPPSSTLAQDGSALRSFVAALPGGWRFAIEFRHASWHQPPVVHWLQDHGVSWVWQDATPLDHEQEGAFEFLPDTAEFLYVRLMGDLERKYLADGAVRHRYRALQWPREKGLDGWALRISEAAKKHRQISWA